MKIAYLLSWELGTQDGVTKKVFAQAGSWLSQGHEVTVYCIAKTDSPTHLPVPLKTFKRKAGSNILEEYRLISRTYKDVYKSLVSYSPDVIYHRLEIYQSGLGIIMKRFPTVVELNSNDLMEIKQISQNSLKGKIRYSYYKRVRDSYLSKAAGFCSVTEEIANLESVTKYNKPTSVIPNSIETNKFNLPQYQERENFLPTIAFMGSPNQAWHGVDKILDLARLTVGKLEFNIIGPTMPEGLNLPNVNFHGFLKQKEYEKVLKKCDIGICTMALHRNNMEEACPLKTREYLAYGLPIILGYKDTAFTAVDLPEWALQIENTESNITNNIDKIISFANKYQGKRLTKAEVKQYIDVEELEKRRVEFLERIVN